MPKSIRLGSSVSLDVAGLTHVGRERQRNEDQFLIARLERNLRVEATSVEGAAGLLPGSTEGTVMLVADGMGGTAAGDVASAVAVRSIADYVCNVLPWADARATAPPSAPAPTRDVRATKADAPRARRRQSQTIPGVRAGLSNALVQGDAEVRRTARARGTKSMGTTLTLAYLQWPQLYVAHAGDSRCYLARDGELSQLTTDHTLAEKLRAHAEKLDIDDASPWHHVLWNALGGGENSAIEPEVHRRELAHGDTLLLCSDGLTKHVNHRAITSILMRNDDATTLCDLLVESALAGGGSDNITVVIARCRDQGATEEVDEPKVRDDEIFERTLPVGAQFEDPLEHTLPLGSDVSVDSDGPTIRRKLR